MTPDIQPLGDYLLVEPISESESMHNGLYLPMATSDDKHRFASHLDGALLQGRVLAAGPGDPCKRCLGQAGKECARCNGTGRLPMYVKVGDVILYPHRQCDVTGETVDVDGKKLLFLHEEQWAIGVVEQ